MEQIFKEKEITITDEEKFIKVLELVKDRCTLLTDFWEHSFFFFKAPKEYETAPILAKWNNNKRNFFETFITSLKGVNDWNAHSLETLFKRLAEQALIKPGELQLPFRIMLVGGKFGPPVFNIAEILGKEETLNRIKEALEAFPK